MADTEVKTRTPYELCNKHGDGGVNERRCWRCAEETLERYQQQLSEARDLLELAQDIGLDTSEENCNRYEIRKANKWTNNVRMWLKENNHEQ